MLRKFIRCFSNGPRQLFIEPTSALLMDTTKLYGHHFPANQNLTVSGHLLCEEEKFDFSSFAHISTNSSGCFDLSKTQSVGGTYTGVEPMGLFWSMIPKTMQSFNFSNASRNLNYTFKVFEGHVSTVDNQTPLAESLITRSIVKNNVIRKEIDVDGIKGTLYMPAGKGPFPAAVTVHGGVKNKHVIEDYAALLANQGFVMLALAFFGVEDLPSNYNTQPIDIEYFEKAVNYLQSLDQVSSNHVGALGFSKGAEISLAMSSVLPQLKFCCLLNSHITSIGAPTVYKGETTEKIREIPENVKFLSENLVDISNCLEDPRNQPNAIHKFTRSNADTLLIVGEKDLNWNSSLCADIYEEEMTKAGKNNFKIVRYPNLGHFVFIPNGPIVTKGAHPLLPKGMYVNFGGSDDLAAYGKETKDLWDEVYAFMEKQKP